MERRLSARLTPLLPPTLALFRVVFGLLFLCHGTSKLFGWPAGSAMAIGAWPYWYAGVIELIAGALITAGFLTRPAALIASGEMAFGYFSDHFATSFWPIANDGEEAVMFCFAFLLLVVGGPGTFAVDTAFGPRAGRDARGTP